MSDLYPMFGENQPKPKPTQVPTAKADKFFTMEAINPTEEGAWYASIEVKANAQMDELDDLRNRIREAVSLWLSEAHERREGGEA